MDGANEGVEHGLGVTISKTETLSLICSMDHFVTLGSE